MNFQNTHKKSIDANATSISSLQQTVIDINTEVGITTKCFNDNLTTYTTEEESIRKSFISVSFWGSNVSKGDSFYLSRIGYNRTTTNDIYFHFRDSSDTLIAFKQFDYSTDHTGTKTYVINNYANGYNVKFIIDWDHVPSQTDYTSGTLLHMNFDPDKVYIDTVNPTLQLMSNNVYKNGSKLYISSEFSETDDLIIEFDKTMFNNLMTFKKVIKVSDTDPTIIEEFDKTPFEILTDATTKDNIGPLKLTGGSWIGGNHGLEGSLTLLTSAYTSGSSTMNVTSTSDFIQTGGYAVAPSGTIFEYTSIVSNQLIGVTGLDEDLTTSDSVRSHIQTAQTTSYRFMSENGDLQDKTLYNINEVFVSVVNEIYDPSTINYTNGLMSVLVYEHVIYRVSKGNIYVRLKHSYVSDVNIEKYYGIQLTGEDYQQIVFIPNSPDTTLQAKGVFPTSGSHGTYQSDKIILSKSDRSRNCAIWFNPNKSYIQNKATYLDTSTPLWEVNANGKIYHNTISKDVLITSGTELELEACYTFFPFENSTDINYNYLMQINGIEHIAFDIPNTYDDFLQIDPKKYNKIEEIKKDSSLTVSQDITSEGVSVQSTSQGGSAIFKLKTE